MKKTVDDRVTAAEKAAMKAEKLGVTAEAIKAGFLHHLKYTLAKDEYSATDHDRYYALALAVRDRLAERWLATSVTYHEERT